MYRVIELDDRYGVKKDGEDLVFRFGSRQAAVSAAEVMNVFSSCKYSRRVTLHLPWPISTNKLTGKSYKASAEGRRQYKSDVRAIVAGETGGPNLMESGLGLPWSGDLGYKITLSSPAKGKRDHDSIKLVFDALEYAGVIENDRDFVEWSGTVVRQQEGWIKMEIWRLQ